MRCLACDFGGSSVKYALVDHDANLTDSGSVPAPLSSKEEFVGTISHLYEHFRDRVDGIAISLPGLLDPRTGVHYGSGAYSSILKGENIVHLVTERCGVRVSVENDGKCGALAEAWCGSLSNVKTGVVLVLGTAIGGGVIVNGDVLHGRSFSAGEFSFSVTGGDGYSMLNEAWMNVGMIGLTYKVCKYKNLDFTIQDASPMLLKYDRIFGPRFPEPTGSPIKIKADGKQIFRWLDANDPDAWRAYREFLHSLTIMIHNIQICIAPERISLGGGLSREKRLLPDLLAEQQTFYKAGGIPESLRSELTTSTFLGECNLIGATYRYMKT